MKLFVTGHNGFIGTHLVNALRTAGHDVAHSAVRLDLTDLELLTKNFSGQDVVFHCAGFAHADDDGSEQFSAQHWAVNYQGAVNVGVAAQRAGVKRLVFVSTAKAVADAPEHIIDENFTVPPASAYGKAKRAAEEALLALANKSDFELVILRPVMVYGRNGGGNLPRIMNGIALGWFPPVPAAGARSLIHIDDLVSALLLAGTHVAAAGQVYFVAHPQPQTTQQLGNVMRHALGKTIPVWTVPATLLKFMAMAGDFFGRIAGKPMPFNREVYRKLMQPAIYSTEKLSSELGWYPRIDIQQGIATMRKESWSDGSD